MTIAVVGFGAGGHAKVMIDILRQNPDYVLRGLLTNEAGLKGTQVMGVPVLGSDDLLAELLGEGVRHFFMGVGAVGDTSPRRRIFEHAQAQGLKAVDAIHPKAIISESARWGEGIAVMAGAVINVEARLGVNVIINTGAIVEHDCVIGDHVHVATGARLAGTVTVGEGSHIGLGAVIRQRISIGKRVIVGAGAVVVKDVPDDTTVIGVPARAIRAKTL